MNRSRKMLAYDTIKDRIIRGILPEGEPVSEREITEDLSISRTPLREAFNMLETESLVEIHPKRGVFVTRVSYQDIISIYSLRIVLEPFAVTAAAPKLPRETLIEQRSTWQLSHPDNDPDAHIVRDNDLHGMIAAATENRYLIQFLLRLHDQATRIRYVSLRRHTRRQTEIDGEHLAIIDQLIDGNGDGAANAMRLHLERARDTALEVFHV